MQDIIGYNKNYRLSDLFTIYPILAFVFRLIFYDSNNNFGYQKIVQDDVIETPAPANYKDINSSSPSPAFTEAHSFFVQ